MNRKANIINAVLSTALAIAALLTMISVCNAAYTAASMGEVLSLVVVGAIVSGFVITLLHELFHVVSAKKNRFFVASVTVWFFRWEKSGGKTVFRFVSLKDAAGYTEIVPKDTENLAKRLINATIVPLIVTLILAVAGVVPLFFAGKMPLWAFCFTATFFPIGIYSFFGNALPAESEGVRNDGALIKGLKRNDDEAQVALALISVQSDMLNGKTPAQTEEKLYFELPQIREDSMNFVMLLFSRYYYYLDKEDYENAKATLSRLASLEDYFDKQVAKLVKTEELYSSCTFSFNAEKADELTFELEKFLNAVNVSETIRAKIAYKLYVKGEKDGLDDFYNRGIREADRCPISGRGEFEKKLLRKMKDDILSD